MSSLTHVTAHTVELNDIQYRLFRDSSNSFSLPERSFSLLKSLFLFSTASKSEPAPFTLIPVSTASESKITRAFLAQLRQKHLDKDDCFQSAFLSRVVFFSSNQSKIKLDDSAVNLLKEWGTTDWGFVKQREAVVMRGGPYFAFESKIWQPWRIYHDKNNAMTHTFLPSSEDKELILNEHGRMMFVPPRSYSTFHPDPEKPLLGFRVVVKDMFDIEGTETTLCNRDWARYHGIKNETAGIVRRLRELGAIIIGKTCLTSMIIREEPMECVDHCAPINPRGDGYQSPSGSSSGPAVAVAAYPWIDAGLASDTNGSCRMPGHRNGCFAIRITPGILPMDGVQSFYKRFDAIAFFSRCLSTLEKVVNHMLPDSIERPLNSSQRSFRIVCPTDFLPTDNEQQMKVIEPFIKCLEESLQTERQEISLADKWRETFPGKESLHAHLKFAGTYDYYKKFSKTIELFQTDHWKRYQKSPFLHKALHWRMNQVKDLTPEECAKQREHLEIYAKWLLNHIFKENTIMVLPIENGKPSPRDENPPPFGLIGGDHPLYITPVSRGSEITLIAGEIWYHSNITGREEPHPVGVSLASSPGTDFALIKIAQKALCQGNLPIKLATGRSIFEEPNRQTMVE